ncbi:ATP-binding cassette domain-containing protein [Schleiferilactobacillus harbinensis]|uniref:ATP-binding cassette domain-containing protein n=1 Tax=Schleiferilactobacillus harbinensis TaxID=304207 RepID=UPI003C7C2A38
MAIHDVSLQLYPGEAVALVGMSGGGKSTIMRLIAGLEKPTGGRLTYQDPAPVMRVMYRYSGGLAYPSTVVSVHKS